MSKPEVDKAVGFRQVWMKRTFPFLERFFPRLAKAWATSLFFKPRQIPLRSEDRDFMEAAGTFSYRIKGSSVCFYEWGQHQKYVLLVHGWGGRASQFKPMAAQFLKAGYKVVTFDAPGHGRSKNNESSMFHFAQAIMIAVQKYGSPEVLIGHSLGAVASLMSVVNGVKPEKLIMLSAPVIGDEILYSFRSRIGASERVNKWLKDYVEYTHRMTFDSVTGLELAKRLEPLNVLIVHDRSDKEVGMEHPYALLSELKYADSYFTKSLGHSKVVRDEDVIKQTIAYAMGNFDRRDNKRDTQELAANN